MTRAERVGNNENLFREVNERIEQLSDRFGLESGTLRIVCECALDTCVAQIEVPVGDYSKVRESPVRFILAPGHELPEFERVVEERESWYVVEKLPGAPAEIAREGAAS